jgi:hypothetical protein
VSSFSIARVALLVASLCLPIASLYPQVSSSKITFEPYSLRTYDGQVNAVELGKITVPEARSTPAGRSLSVAFLRLKSTSDRPGAPIVFLMGGPAFPRRSWRQFHRTGSSSTHSGLQGM